MTVRIVRLEGLRIVAILWILLLSSTAIMTIVYGQYYGGLSEELSKNETTTTTNTTEPVPESEIITPPSKLEIMLKVVTIEVELHALESKLQKTISNVIELEEALMEVFAK